MLLLCRAMPHVGGTNVQRISVHPEGRTKASKQPYEMLLSFDGGMLPHTLRPQRVRVCSSACSRKVWWKHAVVWGRKVAWQRQCGRMCS